MISVKSALLPVLRFRPSDMIVSLLKPLYHPTYEYVGDKDQQRPGKCPENL